MRSKGIDPKLSDKEYTRRSFLVTIAEDDELANWNELPFWTKAELVDSWTIVIIIANFFNICGIIFFIIPDEILSVSFEQ